MNSVWQLMWITLISSLWKNSGGELVLLKMVLSTLEFTSFQYSEFKDQFTVVFLAEMYFYSSKRGLPWYDG